MTYIITISILFLCHLSPKHFWPYGHNRPQQVGASHSARRQVRRWQSSVQWSWEGWCRGEEGEQRRRPAPASLPLSGHSPQQAPAWEQRGGAETEAALDTMVCPFSSPGHHAENHTGEAPTVGLPFQLLSSEVRLQRGRVRAGKARATPWSPSVGSNLLHHRWPCSGLGSRALGRRKLLLWMEMSEGDLRLQKTRKRESRD